jgi:hypothetical protein
LGQIAGTVIEIAHRWWLHFCIGFAKVISMATHENNQSGQQGSGAQQQNTARRNNPEQDGAMQQEFSGMNQSQQTSDTGKTSAGADQGQARSPKQQNSQEGTQNQGNTIKDPDNWTTGEQPMTGAQNSYLHTLASEAGEQVEDDLTKAEASKKIDELQQKTGRGLNQGS